MIAMWIEKYWICAVEDPYKQMQRRKMDRSITYLRY